MISEATHNSRLLNMGGCILTPDQAYCRGVDQVFNYESEGGYGIRSYWQLALTSGGARRDRCLDPETDMGLIISKNKQMGGALYGLAQERYGTVMEEPIFPGFVDLINRPQGTPWREFDFMSMWYLTIAGVDKEIAEGVITNFNACLSPAFMTDFSNHVLDRDVRRQVYADSIGHFGRVLEMSEFQGRFNPVKRLVQVLDTEMSLGCGAERDLALSLGADINALAVNEHHRKVPIETKALVQHYRQLGVNFPVVPQGLDTPVALVPVAYH